jgi:tRNA (mo5U34)-methyltransferase
MTDSCLIEQVNSIDWYHSIPLGNLVTPGAYPLSAERWTAEAMPSDLTSKAVLDVGAWDGYFSFEAEKRGASRVLAIDNFQGRKRDLGAAGFSVAKQFLRSQVEFRNMDVMEVHQIRESFDLILFLGVYYHLQDPIGALKLLLDRLRPGGMLMIEGILLPGKEPKLLSFRPQDIEPTTYCAGTIPWFDICLRQIGYEKVEFVGGTWLLAHAMRYYETRFPSRLTRALYAIMNSIAWSLSINRIPFQGRWKVYRGVLRAYKSR